jgi:phosphoribosylanthranilate isomerase
MTLKSKICGVSTLEVLDYLINHPFAPELIGFIVNYPKSNRYIEPSKLKNLLNTDKKKSKFVAVLVEPKPNQGILEEIKEFPFDYYQIYNCTYNEVKLIKTIYGKKIISAITVENKNDVNKYKDFISFSDIILFDSKGYEKSLSYDHNLLNQVPNNINKMIAGNIQFDDNIDKFKNICNYIDISGGIETSGLKDISKIDIFLNNIKRVNDEN